VVSVETVTVPSLLPMDERTLVTTGVGACVGIVTMTGVGEMHSSMQYPGQAFLTSSSTSSSEHLLAGSSPKTVSQLKLSSFVQSTVTNSGVGNGVGSGVGFFVGLGVG